MSNNINARYRVSPELEIELQAGDQKDLYEKMASAAEVFGNMGKCGVCGAKPRPVVRMNKSKEKFYELHCTKPGCGARFVFGQSKDMKTLFPQREFPKSHQLAGELKPNGGWVKFERSEGQE